MGVRQCEHREVSDMYVPKFLSESSEPDNPAIYQLTEKYISKFGHICAIEGILITDEELEVALIECLRTGKELLLGVRHH